VNRESSIANRQSSIVNRQSSIVNRQSILRMREYRSPDGLTWKVAVQLPSHSGAMLVFQHQDGRSSALDRYAWINSALTTVPRERLSAKDLMERLSDDDLARLFRRSMMVSWNRDFAARDLS
jgi:hypothetical protein